VRRQHPLEAPSDPFRLRHGRARRAVAIVARVVRWSFAAAIETAVHMPAELSGSAALDGVESRSLGR
jgi:hypothetical protein